MIAIRGHLDGKVFVPDEPVDLPRNRPLLLHIEMERAAADPSAQQDLWTVLERHTGTVDAPADWSSQHDHYLYGTPKR